MFVKVCLLVALASVAMSAPTEKPLTVEEQWANFKTDFNRKYESSEEEARRFEIFKENLKTILALNKKYVDGEVTFKLMGINNFADLTNEEFAKTHLMNFNPDPEHPKKCSLGSY